MSRLTTMLHESPPKSIGRRSGDLVVCARRSLADGRDMWPRPARVGTYVRMTSDGSPLVRLRRALRAGDLLLVRTSAAEMPFIGLADALGILELIESQDEQRFESAAIRWAGRLAMEVPDLTLAQLRLAVDALDDLPAAEARATLRALAGAARRPRNASHRSTA